MEKSKSEWFGVYLDAQMFGGLMDMDFGDRWSFYAKFSGDTYDGSIELYFSPECPPEWVLSVDDYEFLKTYGVVGGWANFTDGTEICFMGGRTDRRKADHPRWSEEKWQSEQ